MAEAPVIERQGFKAWTRSAAARPDPDAYRTFPRTLAPGLAAAGGLLVFMGGLGTAIRATAVTSEALPPQPVGTLNGYSEGLGVAVALLGAAVVFVAAMTLWTRTLPRLTLEITALSAAMGTLGRLLELNRAADSLAASASQQPTFLSFHATFGWGAWSMLIGLVLLFLGALVGGLRELDLRRGKEE
jgi:hypothetical protein